MTGLVALLGFAIVAGLISSSSGGLLHEGCATDFKWSQFGEYCYYFISTSEGGKSVQEMAKICGLGGPYVMGSNPIMYLVDVQSKAHNDFIAQEFSGGNRTWFGAVRSGKTLWTRIQSNITDHGKLQNAKLLKSGSGVKRLTRNQQFKLERYAFAFSDRYAKKGVGEDLGMLPKSSLSQSLVSMGGPVDPLVDDDGSDDDDLSSLTQRDSETLPTQRGAERVPKPSQPQPGPSGETSGGTSCGSRSTASRKKAAESSTTTKLLHSLKRADERHQRLSSQVERMESETESDQGERVTFCKWWSTTALQIPEESWRAFQGDALENLMSFLPPSKSGRGQRSPRRRASPTRTRSPSSLPEVSVARRERRLQQQAFQQIQQPQTVQLPLHQHLPQQEASFQVYLHHQSQQPGPFTMDLSQAQAPQQQPSVPTYVTLHGKPPISMAPVLHQPMLPRQRTLLAPSVPQSWDKVTFSPTFSQPTGSGLTDRPTTSTIHCSQRPFRNGILASSQRSQHRGHFTASAGFHPVTHPHFHELGGQFLHTCDHSPINTDGLKKSPRSSTNFIGGDPG